MGGFVLAKSTKDIDVLPLTILALRRMEFRGKDCSGIAWVESGEMRVVKDSSPIAELSSKYALNRVSTSLALGHTRYSTHGKADPRNAHPHLDCERIVAVAGDGALRNYEELYAELVERSHRVVSKSDFELVAHLIENYVRKGLNYTKAFAEAVVRLEGIVAAAALFRDGSAAIYTSHQPVYVGLGRDVVVASSTLSSLYGTVLGYAVVEGGELVFISSGGRVEFADLSGRSVAKKFLAYDLGESLVSTDGYPNHMLREIYEVPYSLLRTVSAVQSRYLELASKVALRSSRLFVIANGTSLHAGHIFSYYLSELAGRIPIVVSASEFPLYYLDSVGVGDAVLAISQSGETSEVVRSVYEARLRGATVIGVTNNINSRLTRFSNLYLPIAAGPELAVPATKTFTSTLVLLYILAKSVSEVSSKPVSKILSEAWREVGEVY
ncbi:MAG: SIS domain-containing protein, partial [Sulfolobales archaeon]|nr:SIS domain-containing protein [Sulfolobales archaeon]